MRLYVQYQSFNHNQIILNILHGTVLLNKTKQIKLNQTHTYIHIRRLETGSIRSLFSLKYNKLKSFDFMNSVS